MTKWLNDHQINGTPKVDQDNLRKRQIFASVINTFDKPKKKPRKRKTTLSQHNFGDCR